MVYRIYVEKKSDLANEANALASEIKNILGITALEDLRLLNRYDVPYYLVYTNTPGEIVYEDKYQIVARADDITIQPIPKSWSPEE